MSNIKLLNLINYTSDVIKLDKESIFVDTNNFIDKEMLKNDFFDLNKEELSINIFSDYESKIQELANANSINEYNSLITEMKGSNPIFDNLQLFGDEFSDEETFMISKNTIYKDFIKSLVNLYPEIIRKYSSIDNKINTPLYLSYGLVYGKINNNFNISTFIFNREINLEIDFLTVKFKLAKTISINNKAILYLLDNVGNYEIEPKLEFNDTNELIEYLSNLFNYSIELTDAVSFNDIIENVSINSAVKLFDLYCLVSYDVSKSRLNDEIEKINQADIEILNTSMQHDNQYYKELEITSAPLVQISKPLNLYQKYSLRSAVNENTLIYGPTGTGKSEVIANIIANLLAKNESVLMTAEKQECINVVYSRLGSLKDFALRVNSTFYDKLSFFGQISKLIGQLGNVSSLNESNIRNEEVNNLMNTNERTFDYNHLNKKFINEVKEYIDFCNLRNNSNYDYKSYLVAKQNINLFVQDNIDEIKKIFDEHSLKYPRLQNEVDFIVKVSEYDIFVKSFNLDKELLSHLNSDRKKFISFLVNYGFKDLNYIDYNKLSKDVEMLKTFLQDNWLINNSNFMELLEKNNKILIENYHNLVKIKEILESSCVDSNNANAWFKKVLNWLIANKKYHSTILHRLSSSSDNKLFGIYNYFEKGINSPGFINKKMFVKYPTDQAMINQYLMIIEAMNLFNKLLENSDNNVDYVKNIILDASSDVNYESMFSPINVFMLLNHKLLTEQFIEMYNKKIEYFDEDVINSFYKSRLNQISKYLKVVNEYQTEILANYTSIAELDLDLTINQYIKDNADYLSKLNSSIYKIFIEYIKNKLSQKDEGFRQKIVEMYKLSSNTQQLPEISEFITQYYEQLRILFPAWFISPDVIAEYIPLEKAIFDNIIFDEASQIVLERSYSLLYRAKKAVITGDPKQLQPEVGNYVLENISKSSRIDDINLDDAVSLLDRAKTLFWNTYYLKNHYRSLDYKLIDYSNLNFYNNELVYISKNKNEIYPYVIITDEKATNSNGVNSSEAKRLISELKKILNNFEESKNYSKILIVTFTDEQAKYINKIIYENQTENEQIIRLIRDNVLIINSVRSLQGTEADLVLISMVYDAKSTNLDVMASRYAENYLNIAITRAKYKEVIVKSINYKVANSNWENKYPVLLKYIKYLDEIESQIKLRSKNKEDLMTIDNSTINSSFKDELVNKMTAYFKKSKMSGYQCVKNLKIGSFVIDIAIYNKSISNIKLILMLNEYKKHISLDEFLGDLDIFTLLQNNGYDVYWVQETKWLKSQEDILLQIRKRLLAAE